MDLVVTVPKDKWAEWCEEGALPGQPCPRDVFYCFTIGWRKPDIRPGERVYVVAHGRLRGYSPLVRIEGDPRVGYRLIRHGGAVAVTVPEPIRGFRGWAYRWWDTAQEVPFPDWHTDNVPQLAALQTALI